MMQLTEIHRRLALLALSVAAAAIAIHFIGWPLNRDITTYATVARELLEGEWLYLDVWDLKPPAIFGTYLLAQSLTASTTLQILLLHLVPTLVVLLALAYSATAAGFGRAAGIWSGAFWVALSGDVLFQTQEPNTEIFINACCALAFLQLLGLAARKSAWPLVSIGCLFALAFLFKTVAIATAAALGIAYLLIRQQDTTAFSRLRQLSVMAAAGAATLAATVAWFASTGRFDVFTEVMVGSGLSSAGDVLENVIDGLTFLPIVGENPILNLLLAVGPWMVVAAVALFDRDRMRSWVLLGAYAFGSLVAVGMPGSFYAHYFQLLLPPFCLGVGWLAGLAGSAKSIIMRRAVPIVLGLSLLATMVHEFRVYVLAPEDLLAGTPQEIYMETESLGRRLGKALAPNEEIFQWGEESGLYWYSGKRPAAAVLVYNMYYGPQAGRLTAHALKSLETAPPDVIVVVNDAFDGVYDHPVFAWIDSHYTAVQPAIPGERRFFTFYLLPAATADLRARVLGTSGNAGDRN
jgi:hypothetical protein